MVKRPRTDSVDDANRNTDLAKARLNLELQISQLEEQLGRISNNNPQFDKNLFIDVRLIKNTLTNVVHRHAEFLDTYELRINEILTDLERDINKLDKASDQQYNMRNIKYRRMTPQQKSLHLIPGIRSSIAIYRQYISSGDVEIIVEPEIPRQEPAPIKVEIVDNTGLHLITSQTHKGSVSLPSIERLREAAEELLSRTIEQVELASNADPRLGPNLRGLLNYLSKPIDGMPVEALGLNYKFAYRSFQATEETLPDALSEQIEQLLTTINVILNQFDEWRLYITAESATQLTASDRENVLGAADELKKYLNENTDFVEISLIDRLSEITDAYSRGLINIDSIAVPLITSFGNIFSEISRFIFLHAPDYIGGAGLAGATVLLIGFAVKTLERFFPSMSQFSPLRYLIDIYKYVHKNFSLLKDLIKT